MIYVRTPSVSQNVNLNVEFFTFLLPCCILIDFFLNNQPDALTYLLTPWSRVPLEKLTGFCS